MLRLKILCNLLAGGKCECINCRNIFAGLFLHLNWKVGWTKWFSLFFFWFCFVANLVICIAVSLCNHIFPVLLRNLVLIVQIFQHLKNFWITFHWWFNPIQDGLFWSCSRMGGTKSVTHILQWWNLAQLYLTQRRS